MNRLKNISILIVELLFGYIILNGLVPFNCFFRDYLGIRCPGCGLTRSFKSLLKLNFKEAIHYNIIGIPLFILLIILTIFLIIDSIKNTNKTLIYLNNFLKKYYFLIIIILIITMLINNLNKI